MSLRKPVFWIVLAFAAVMAAVFTFVYFPRAFPLVNLNIQMNRESAFENASALAKKYNWGPKDFAQAASFRLEDEVQNFVELEGGGKEAFNRILGEGLYSPYTWRVRHYREKETNETEIRFTPAGRPFGFVEKIPEDEPGATLPADSARTIAETAALNDWTIDLDTYDLVEESQEVRPGGRTDHTFVYERGNQKIGEGRYRLRLVVSGDKLTEVTHFIKIPEGFERRYEEMRSANWTIGIVGQLAAALVYILGGCIIGLFFLLRKGWVLWRTAVGFGVLVALLQALAMINQWPLAWMRYDTALSMQAFMLQQIVNVLVQFMILAILLSLSFMAAESLSRRAFPHHIQLWKSWSLGVANSPSVLGRSAVGYLLVPLFFAYEVILYFFADRVLGWWTPSHTLFHPDVLATYFPWFSSIAISFQAGFWEECLFRAVPIAGAALIGQRFGHRRAWIIAAFVVQALIFGAGHAAYPNQPAYARVVELIIPSLFFGALYLYFGLLPGIVLHFTFDVIWFALPLFVSSAPGIWLDKVLVIALTLVPLWVVLGARWRARRWDDISEEHLNASWSPPVSEEPEVAGVPLEEPAAAGPVTLPSGVTRLLQIGGIVGLVVWAAAGDFQDDAPALDVTRQEAVHLAEQVLSERGVELPESWEVLGSVNASVGQQHRFIWQTGDEALYGKLIGNYLRPPHWRVRFVTFEGDVEERAEEYVVGVAPDGEILRYRHRLPEARSGETLSEDEARTIALSVVETNYGLEPSQLKEISAEPSKLPARQDWLFTFADEGSPLSEGEARIVVNMAGEQVVDAYREIHVPEDWQREDRSRNTVAQVVQILSGLILALLFLAGVVGAVVRWSRRQFSVRTFLVFLSLAFLINFLARINGWPATKAGFSTAEPLTNQILITVSGWLFVLLFLSTFVALIVGFVHRWRVQLSVEENWTRFLSGLSLGVIAVALGTLPSGLVPSRSPTWAGYGAADSYLPLLDPALDSLLSYMLMTSLFLLIGVAVDHYTSNWSRRTGLFSALLIVLGFTVAGTSVETPTLWLVSGLLAGTILLLAYIFVLRFDLKLIPLATAAVVILRQLQQGFYEAYPWALAGAFLTAVLVGLLGFYWWWRLSQEWIPEAP
ncbi:CPBP family intramembrane metalloprotease [Acidobacteria bacterium AH-259-O06]|nr:CPBP family intramembrane metalloprotease [Acidobacteria bacterium AH-259-O06]